MSRETDRAARIEAYNMGYNRFQDSSRYLGDHEQVDLSLFKQTATWANNTAPKLRRLAGAEDISGAGTYTGMGEDEAHRLEELIDMWEQGAEDGLRNNERSFQDTINA